MAEWSDPRLNQATAGVTIDGRAVGDASIDAGLRSHMLKIYNYMASGVLLTAVVAMLFARTEFAQQTAFNGGILTWIIALSPLAILFTMNYNRSVSTLQTLFWTYATLTGLSMAVIFLLFTQSSIALAFFATTASFAGLSLWGYTTKKDLTGWSSFLIMGVVGLIVATVGNIWLKSDTLNLVISCVGVLIFAGLTAYYTQYNKSLYYQVAGTEMQDKAAIIGAFQLYLAFINMFNFILNFAGNRN